MHCDESLQEVQSCKSCSWEMEGYVGPLIRDLPDARYLSFGELLT